MSVNTLKDLSALGAALDRTAQVQHAERVEASMSASTPAPALQPTPAPVVAPKRDQLGRAYATGRRKVAVARVWLRPGSGKVTVNGRALEVYFGRPVLRMLLQQPFEKTHRNGEFDVVATVAGGGLSGQAGALRHGISRALVNYEPPLRPALKAAGFLTRDSRMVERKKYGRRKARRSFQFSKR